MRLVSIAVVGLLLASCSGHRQRPTGPAPEYERPVVMPWDAGAPIDPLDNVKGEAVDDDEPPPPADGGSSDGAPQLSPDGGVG